MYNTQPIIHTYCQLLRQMLCCAVLRIRCKSHLIIVSHDTALIGKVPCRGRHGRSHDSSNSRGSSHPQEGFHGSDQSSAVSNQAPEVVLGGPEQSPLGRSPSNRTYSSANHLLNFQYDSYAQYGRGGRGSNEGRGRGGYRRPAPKPMPYNRNKFLQANFRFLVSDAGNLRRHEADADLMLDWDDVVQVC